MSVETVRSYMTRPSPSRTTARMLAALKFKSANAVQRLKVTANVMTSSAATVCVDTYWSSMA